MSSADIEQLLQGFYHPGLKTIDLSLDRMQHFLTLLGAPQTHLPPVVHVAGTNGKGSLLAYLEAMLRAGGYRVHKYISPHLVRFNERIVLDGTAIDDACLLDVLQRIDRYIKTQPVTFFEATTAAAFLAFSESPADIILLETGMGGRFDATNVITAPRLTAITPIAMDHTEFLGNEIAAIAYEKAGIMKQGVPCVIGRQVVEAEQQLTAVAQRRSAAVFRLGKEWDVKREGMQAYYRSPVKRILLQPGLAGNHQYDNAATALACIEQLPEFTLNEPQMMQGMANVVWPGRLQPLRDSRYNRLLPPDMALWLDGGHNPQGGAILAAWLKEQQVADIYLICGMVQGKDTAGYLHPLAGIVRALYAISIPDEALSQPAQDVEQAARSCGMEAFVAPSIENALQTVAERAKTPAIVCICGSLYLAGYVLKQI